ncbi:MAG: hypothetical protein HY814_04265 [Candidatus Riflebacteria bacterium]|nr:hypothetical protein [Candidatus Riflebacteria bacterium]
MFRDPAMSWDKPVAYDELAELGIGPDTTMRQVKDSADELMSRGLRHKRWARDELRLQPSRLGLDFFYYRPDRMGSSVAEAPGAETRAALGRALGRAMAATVTGSSSDRLRLVWLPELAAGETIPDEDLESR